MPSLDLASLLEAEQVDPRTTLVLRHRPSEPRLRAVFPWLAAEREDIFDAYQRTHGPRTEAALSAAKHVASFIGLEAARAVFVGLYKMAGASPVAKSEYEQTAEYRELLEQGMQPWPPADAAAQVLCFDLRKTAIMAPWKGRLVIDWPPPDRAWYRWADVTRNRFPVQAIHGESLFAPSMPSWDELTFDWPQLGVLPERWRAALAEWRGVYLIFDTFDGKSYVGSAYGADNILGRWLGYAATGHGGNALLRDRDPRGFRFSILQRLSPDLPPDEVIVIESSWKTRLHTRAPHGLNAN